MAPSLFVFLGMALVAANASAPEAADAATRSVTVFCPSPKKYTVASGIDKAALNVAKELRTVPIDPNRGRAEDIARMLERMLDRPDDDRVRIVPLEDLIREQRSRDTSATESNAPAPGKVSMGNTLRSLMAGVLKPLS